MREIGEIYGKLGNIREARHWLERALCENEEIGDVSGMGRCLASLAAAAHDEKSPSEAKVILERLITLSEGKPPHYQRAGALHDLGVLELSRGNVASAKGLLQTAKELAEKYGYEDVLDALKVSLEKLNDAEIFYQPANRDLPTLVQELRDWCDRYPEMREAILPLWYYIHRAELWSVCRSMLGVKFLICTPESAAFRRTTSKLQAHGDLFAWGTSAVLKHKPRTELIPYFFIPRHLKTALFKEKPPDPETTGKALIGALRDEAYILLPFDDTVKGKSGFLKGDTNLYVLGRHARLSPLIRKLMLDTPKKDLISSKTICLPLSESAETIGIMHILLVAWENRMIPILSERIPYSDKIQAVCDSHIDLPNNPSAQSDKKLDAKEMWKRLLWSCQTNPHAALSDFCGGMGELAGTQAHKALSARVYLLRFRAGSQEVVHPAVVALAL